jgi:hypothetical protein
MFRATRPFRSNLLALLLLAFVIGTAACDGKPPTDEGSTEDYCNTQGSTC